MDTNLTRFLDKVRDHIYSQTLTCKECHAVQYSSTRSTFDLDEHWSDFVRAHSLCGGHEVDVVTGAIISP